MSYRFATYEKRGRIAYVTLNRPEVMNALHLEAHLELAEIWEDFRDDPGRLGRDPDRVRRAGVLGRQRSQGHRRADGRRR